MLQCVAVSCIVLRCVAGVGSVLRRVVAWCSVSQCTHTHTLQMHVCIVHCLMCRNKEKVHARAREFERERESKKKTERERERERERGRKRDRE